MLGNGAAYLEDHAMALSAAPPLDMLSGKSVLITGASGLIGSFLVDALMNANRERDLNARVFALSRNRERLERRFQAHLGDPRFCALAQDVCATIDPSECYDFVIHAGSPAHPLAFSMDPVGTMRANLLGTMNLLEHIKGQAHGRLLYVSSGEVYGENRGSQPDFSEDSLGYIDCANPRSCYPESKRAAETLCASFARQFGVDALIARPCHVFGPTITDENSRADAQFLRNALSGEDIVLKSAGSQVRSYLYVADAACALLWVLLRGESGQAYNLANPDSVLSIREYASLLAQAAGVSLRMELPSDAEQAGYSKVTRATLNADKLAALGFRPQYGAQAGIERMVTICMQA